MACVPYSRAEISCVPFIGPIVAVYNTLKIEIELASPSSFPKLRYELVQIRKKARHYHLCAIVGNILTITAMFILVFGTPYARVRDELETSAWIISSACNSLSTLHFFAFIINGDILERLQDPERAMERFWRDSRTESTNDPWRDSRTLQSIPKMTQKLGDRRD